jgi:hypothetical protein
LANALHRSKSAEQLENVNGGILRHAAGNWCDSQDILTTKMLSLADKNENVIGFQWKEFCYDGNGLLHRAFSVFFFDQTGRLLLSLMCFHTHP